MLCLWFQNRCIQRFRLPDGTQKSPKSFRLTRQSWHKSNLRGHGITWIRWLLPDPLDNATPSSTGHPRIALPTTPLTDAVSNVIWSTSLNSCTASSSLSIKPLTKRRKMNAVGNLISRSIRPSPARSIKLTISSTFQNFKNRARTAHRIEGRIRSTYASFLGRC